MSGGSERPINPLHSRYASPAMARVFSPENRYRSWRRVWLLLARSQQELGLPISDEQLAELEAAAPQINLERVAAIEEETRHDVVAHLRHFAELAPHGGGILHLGATSAFVTDNTDVLQVREALEVVQGHLITLAQALRDFARRHRAVPALAYTHFQPAQLTTVGKRACLWLQDVAEDLRAVEAALAWIRCRGAKGTTGTQASFLKLFDGDHERVRKLDAMIAEGLGFASSWTVTGQTYPRKQDSRVLAVLAGIAESCHKMATDIRLLQGVGELAEPFGKSQVGSSAMAYKRNPIRAERICGLSRRLITDSLNAPLNAATQWLERSLDDSSNRRLVLTDSFLTADAILTLAAGLVAGLEVHAGAVQARVDRELPFMATENILMEAVLRGGDRQVLHETIRRHSLAAHESVARGAENPLIASLAAEPGFPLTGEEMERLLDAGAFTGRSAEQVGELTEIVDELLAGRQGSAIIEPKV